MAALEGHLEWVQWEHDKIEMHLQPLKFVKEQVATLMEANEVLKSQKSCGGELPGISPNISRG